MPKSTDTPMLPDYHIAPMRPESYEQAVLLRAGRGTEARELHDEPDAPAPHIRYHRECCLSDYRTDAAPDPTLSPDIAHPD